MPDAAPSLPRDGQSVMRCLSKKLVGLRPFDISSIDQLHIGERVRLGYLIALEVTHSQFDLFPLMLHLNPSSLPDRQWAAIEPHLLAPKPGGSPRLINLRIILNGILCALKTSCQWRELPREFAPEVASTPTSGAGRLTPYGSASTIPCTTRSLRGVIPDMEVSDFNPAKGSLVTTAR